MITFRDDELAKYLADNLRIELSLSTAPDYGEGDTRYLKGKVQLLLDGKVIAKDEDSCAVGEK